MPIDNFEELRSAGKGKRPRASKAAAGPMPIGADIAAVALVKPSAPEPVELPEPPVAAPADFQEEVVPAVERIEHPEPPVAAPENFQEEVVPAVERIEHPEPIAAAPADTQEEPIMATTAENVLNTNTATGAKVFADMNDRAKGAMERGSKMFEEMNGFTKGNVEALVESGRVAAKGMERFGQEAADYARRQFETATANVRALTSAKSPTEFVRLQAEQTRAAFDQAVAQTSHATEAMLKLAGDVAQPISNRVAVVADRIKTAA